MTHGARYRTNNLAYTEKCRACGVSYTSDEPFENDFICLGCYEDLQAYRGKSQSKVPPHYEEDVA